MQFVQLEVIVAQLPGRLVSQMSMMASISSCDGGGVPDRQETFFIGRPFEIPRPFPPFLITIANIYHSLFVDKTVIMMEEWMSQDDKVGKLGTHLKGTWMVLQVVSPTCRQATERLNSPNASLHH